MSETLPLSAERLRELYETFRKTVVPSDWYRSRSRRYLEFVERVQGWSDDELRSPDAQQELWESDALGDIMKGPNVGTRAVSRDEQVAGALAALRRRHWPETPEARAEAMRREYDEIAALVQPRSGKNKPAAKILRVFAALQPAYFHSCSFHTKFQRQVSQLILGYQADRVRGSVRVRDRLRQVLGAEEDLAMHVERSVFCLWLHGHHERLIAGEQDTAALSAAEPAALADGEQSTTLAPWPFARQRKGLPGTGGYARDLHAVIQSCEGGASHDDVFLAMREEHGLDKLQARSVRVLMNTAKALGLIERRDGLWWPSEAGEDILDPDETDILIERLIERVFGIAQLLRFADRAGPGPRAKLISALRELYPAWQTDRTPNTILAWASSLGLIERNGQHYHLTEYGSGWAKRLPDELSAADELAMFQAIDEDEDASLIDLLASHEGAAAFDSWATPSFADIWDDFGKDDALSQFVFEQAQLAELHLAWHPPEDGARARKRFVILSGLSGTGKTAILTHYARIYCRLAGIERPDKHCTVVAVSPDWRDPSGLLGYVNALTRDPTYLREPTLEYLLDARANPHRPYFLILDEMNLAHPEHYFAPFLSAMETGGRLHLHAHESLNDVPQWITWPRNLFIGGTVNMDETTHGFSDKVLDRAFTIELWDVDLPRYFERRRERDAIDIAGIDELYGFFIALNGELARVRRHVGYRSMGEAIDFVRSGVRAGLASDADALWTLVDRAVHAKVLPRLRGHDHADLRHALDAARQACQQRGLSRCVDKLSRMLAQLDETGVTRFFS
jgi:5-methylcytosine-specific restriction protein B